MTRFGGALAIVVIGGALGGCASSRFEAQRSEAERRLERAEAAGVPDALVERGWDHHELAVEAEERAEEEREEAVDLLAEAQEREHEARERLAQHQQALTEIGVDLRAAEANLRPAEVDYDALRDRGLTVAEAEQVSGPKLQLLRQRVEALRRAREAMEMQSELARLEVRTAEASATAAEAQLRAAERRLELAGVLYELAAQQASEFELVEITNSSEALQRQLRGVRP